MTLTVEGVTTLLEIFDMSTSVAFYRDVLGFEVIATSSPAGDYTRPPRSDPARVAHHADTGLFFSCRDLDGAYDALRAKGLEIGPPVVRDYGMRQLWLKDPDGYGLCFQWPVASEAHAGR